MQNIYLIGFMGSGKSTVGARYAEQFHYGFRDLDEEIESHYGKSPKTLIQNLGVHIFRHLETGILYQIPKDKYVVATGGGIVERSNNLEYMQYSGKIIFLQASFQTIQNRLKNDQSRPLWNTDLQERKSLFDKREKLYNQFSDMVIPIDGKTIDAVAREIFWNMHHIDYTNK